MTIPRFAALAVMASFLATPAIAQPATPSLAQEQQLAQEIAQLNWVNGPNTIEVANIAGFDIPAGYQMLTPPDSLKFIQLNGNATTTDDNGDYILQNVDPNSGWFAILTYEPIGHIKDVGPLNPTGLLATLQALSTQDNANRARQNIPPMTLTGWAVPPSYDAGTHTLQWALNFTNPDGSSLVNLNTDILGRTGALKIIVVDSPNTLAADLADFNHAMTGFSFNTGQRYQDAQTTDPATTLTLTALITGLTTQTPPPAPPPPPTTQPPRRQNPNHLPAIAKALTALALLIAAGLGLIWWMRK